MKYIHVDGENRDCAVFDKLMEDWYGWVFEVADDYTFVLTLENMDARGEIFELLEDDTNARLVKKH